MSASPDTYLRWPGACASSGCAAWVLLVLVLSGAQQVRAASHFTGATQPVPVAIDPAADDQVVPAAASSAAEDALLNALAVVSVVLIASVLALAWDRRRERRLAEERFASLDGRLQLMSQALVEGQDDERRRLARHLHDDLGQLLTAICMDVQQARRTQDDDTRTRALERAESISRTSVERVRELSHDLRPAALDVIGLRACLEDDVAAFEQRTGLAVDLDAHWEHDDVPSDIATHVHRVAQEALTNIVRHARASHVRIAVVCDDDAFALSITDDGVGGAPGGDGSGVGLAHMAERAKLVGGTLDVRDAEPAGTEVRLRVPLGVVAT